MTVPLGLWGWWVGKLGWLFLRLKSMCVGKWIFSFIVVGSLVGCSGLGSSAKVGEPGEYAGSGKFTSSAGSLDVKAQLDLSEEGTYQLLFLEPMPLTMFGIEEGNWVKEGDNVRLTPVAKKAKENAGVIEQIGAATSSNRPEKLLTKKSDGLHWSDSKMQLVFTVK